MTLLWDFPEPPVLRDPRVALEPLQVEHAVEMAELLNDLGLHTFIGGTPATEPELTKQVAPPDTASWSPPTARNVG